MKITAICGSPREKNTQLLIGSILNLINSNDADIETELIMLSRMNIRHCDGCDECQNDGSLCEIKDEMAEIAETLAASDAIILGSPVYFDNVSGVMKDFMDRTYPLWKKKSLKGKIAGIVATGSWDMNSINKAVSSMEAFCTAHGMKVAGYLGAVDSSIGFEGVLNEAGKIAHELVEALYRAEAENKSEAAKAE